MIPRTKVNYLAGQLLKALTVTERSTHHRNLLIGMLSNYLHTDNVILMPSGRCGLYCILKAVNHMKRVIIPAYTCKAVAEAALMAGKEIVYVDIEENSFNMDASALEKVLVDKSVVIATHQFGIPCRIKEIIELCRKRDSLVIEDAAASLGTRIDGKLTGAFGDAAFFSFDSTKLINVPMKGGFVIAKDPTLCKKIHEVCDAELRPMPVGHKFKLFILAFILTMIENPFLYRIFHTVYFQFRGKCTEESPDLDLAKGPFYSYSMTEWQAAIAVRQIENIHYIIKTRQDLYAYYFSCLSGMSSCVLPPEDLKKEWACIRFPIRIKGNKMSFYHKAVKKGIDFAFSFTYPPCPEGFVNSRHLADAVLDIPYYLKLDRNECDFIVSVLKNIDQNGGVT